MMSLMPLWCRIASKQVETLPPRLSQQKQLALSAGLQVELAQFKSGNMLSTHSRQNLHVMGAVRASNPATYHPEVVPKQKHSA